MARPRQPGGSQAGRRRGRWARWLTVAVASAGVVALLVAVLADAGARARARQEQSDLTNAKAQLTSTRHDIAVTEYEKAVTAQKQGTLQVQIASTLRQLATMNAPLASAETAEVLQGASISTLQACLGGVQNALQQIRAGNKDRAAQDISDVSGPCLALDGGSTRGLVYPFDFADPDVILVGQTYFAYATNSVAGNIQILQSADLTHWATVGNALPHLPHWAAPNYTWAPSVAQIGGHFVLYYAVNLAGSKTECISVATASAPQGPYEDDSTSPLECQPTLGGSIDPSAFGDSNGKPYLLWKSGGPLAKIWSQPLNPAGTAFATGTTPTALLIPTRAWEKGTVEAPDMVTQNGHYFLFFSGNNWDSANYAVGVAICKGPLGPCEDASPKPLLASGPGVAGPGGPSVFADKSGTYWVAFHGWVPGAVGFPNSRELYLRRLDMAGSLPVVGAPA